MSQAAKEPVHALVVPLFSGALLLPSTLVAEVVNVAPLQPLPLGEPWILGLLNWRARAVPVVSFDVLLGARAVAPGRRSKIVVLYPLGTRPKSEFFALMTSGEPQPRTFVDAGALSDLHANVSPYVATDVRVDGNLLSIPDLSALDTLFYPAF